MFSYISFMTSITFRLGVNTDTFPQKMRFYIFETIYLEY